MKAAPFAYHRPSTEIEALSLVGALANEDAHILAGGQSLTPMMAFRLARPKHLIDINGLTELNVLRNSHEDLLIGALTRHSAFEAPMAGDITRSLLRLVVPHIAHQPIRSRGTFCGSLANADPASEWCLVMATLDGVVTVANASRRRAIAARDFFQGSMSTALGDDEMILSATLPLLPSQTRFGFVEFSRRAGDFAIAMALATYEIAAERMTSVRFGIGGAEDRPRRIAAVEEALEGERPSESVFAHAGELAAHAIDPMVDHSTSAEYRRTLVAALTQRALEQAWL